MFMNGDDVPGGNHWIKAGFEWYRDLGIIVGADDFKLPFPTLDEIEATTHESEIEPRRRDYLTELRTAWRECKGRDPAVSWPVPDSRFFEGKRFLKIKARYELEVAGYKVDDGVLHEWSWSRADNLQALKVLAQQKVVIAPPPLDESSPLKPGEEHRAFALTVRKIPFPEGLPHSEFVGFRKSREVRQSIGAFRDLTEKLIGLQAPANYVIEELLQRYEDYKVEVQRLKAKQVMSNVKFILGTSAGVLEDILKLRIESLVKRPFELAEHVLTAREARDALRASPFLFATELCRD